MQHLEINGAVRHIYIYVIRRLKVTRNMAVTLQGGDWPVARSIPTRDSSETVKMQTLKTSITCAQFKLTITVEKSATH